MTNETQAPWSREEFEAKLREKGKGYHIYHPIHAVSYTHLDVYKRQYSYCLSAHFLLYFHLASMSL